jgi:hypothetical protein
MNFNELLKEYDIANDGKVTAHAQSYFEDGFLNDYKIDYDKDDIPKTIVRKDLENIKNQDLTTIKRWVEWWNVNNKTQLIPMAVDVTRDVGISLTRK